ncbi:MAG: hypothetical protein Ct9H300mP1_09090 [Planctomycetaceae bacterium]|nr:MAG: hypothetical protein Ct9H300mP1_09090 [Planctomycetaceae bacterium]
MGLADVRPQRADPRNDLPRKLPDHRDDPGAPWFCSQILLFKIIFHNVQHITPGWNEYQYFAFMATGMLINAGIEACSCRTWQNSAS